MFLGKKIQRNIILKYNPLPKTLSIRPETASFDLVTKIGICRVPDPTTQYLMMKTDDEKIFLVQRL